MTNGRSTDGAATVVREAASEAANGHDTRARQLLSSIDLQSIIASRKAAMDLVWGARNRQRYTKVQTVASRRGSLSESMKLPVFQRDGFTCRYCGRRTIYIPVLKALSALYPDILPYHPNWRPLEDHILYWVYGTSLEHHEPLARGGAEGLENYVTTCYQCNDVKNYYLIEELGWRLKPVGLPEWDGGYPFLPALVTRGPARVENPIVPRPTRNVTRSTSAVTLSPGLFIGAQLPGKRSRRQYRIDRVDTDWLVLTEMWRSDRDRTWVPSKNPITVPTSSLEGVEILRDRAPEAGSGD